jgi:hypothetical protein
MDAQSRDEWSFSVEEVSAGVYRARGVDLAGRTVEASGTDPETLLQECRRAAAACLASLRPNSLSSW